MILLVAGLAVGLVLAMAGAWAIARRPGFSGWTDVIWSFATGLAGVVGALAPIDGAPSWRAWLVAALAGAWGLRLGLHIMQRTTGHGEDPRYKAFRDEWGESFDVKLFWFLQIQAACGWLLAVAILVAARNPAAFPAWSDYVGAGILILSVAGETVADRQLRAWKQAGGPKASGSVCEQGLWGWSRHPNYFFEWFGWVGYAVIAIGPAAAFPWGWAALGGPALMYWLLVFASGIPPLEQHMLKSRGDAFRDYQRRVSAFVPLPPKGT